MENGFQILLSDIRGKGNHEQKDTFDPYTERTLHNWGSKRLKLLRKATKQVAEVSTLSREPGACESSQCINKRPKDDFTNYNNVKLHCDFYFFVLISLED